MADPWDVAKHVLLFKTLPPGCDRAGDDHVIPLLARLADALRAAESAEVERLSRRALRDSADPFIPTAFLVTRLLTDANRAAEADALIADCGAQEHPERRALATALLASASAQQVRPAASARYAAESLAALQDVDDDVFTGFIEGRLAEAATWRGDLASTLELAERSVRRFERHGADTMAAASLTMQFLPRFEAGDIGALRELLAKGEAYAKRGGSPALLRTYANFRVVVAAMTGDEASLEGSSGPIAARSAHDSFVAHLYAAMPHAWNGRWHDYLAMVRSAEPVTPAHRALLDATLAIGAAATRDDAEARTRWRRAVHRLATGGMWNLADTRIRRFARALACVAGVAVGDVARANRAALPLRGTRQFAVFTGEPDPMCAGYQRIVAAMREARKRTEPAVLLTPSQTAILKTLATDASITEIARNDPERRSVATIRSHVQRLYEVLDVHSRTGAVLKAKELLLI
jgi:DNA-binding CsgD family transcriptional regulator